MRLLARLLIPGLPIAALALTACGDDDDNGGGDPTTAPQTPPAQDSPADGAQPTEEPTPGGSTNIPEVDDVIDAILSGDPAQVRPRVRFQTLACEDAPGLGGPPPCRPGESPGTEVDVIAAGACELEYKHMDEFEAFVQQRLQDMTLFGVYEWPDDASPSADYAVVFEQAFEGEEPRGLAVVVDGGIMVAFDFTCGGTAEDLPEILGLGEPVFP